MKSLSLNQSLPSSQSLSGSSAAGQTEMFPDLALPGLTANQAPKEVALKAPQAPTKSAPIPAPAQPDPNQTTLEFTAPGASDGAQRGVPTTSATDAPRTPSESAAATDSAPTPGEPVVMSPIPAHDEEHPDAGQPVSAPIPIQQPHTNHRPPIFAYFTKSRGLGTNIPTPISWHEPIPIDCETSAREAVGLATGYQKIKDQDQVARLDFLGGKVALFGPLIRREQNECLIAAVALAYIIRDSLFAVLCDEHDRQLFKTKQEFIAAYLRYHGISDSATRVSRLLAGAELWILLVEGGLPAPASLNRLEGLLSLPSDIAVYCYTLLAQAAGNQVPALEAIESKAAELKGTLKLATTKTGEANSQKLNAVAAEGQRLLEAARDPAHDGKAFLADFAALVADLVALAAVPKKTAPGGRVAAADPTLACPVRVEVKDLALIVQFNLPPKDHELVTLVRVRALKKGWVQTGPDTWSLSLATKGPSARASKIGEICHRLTQTLATFDYRGPALPALS